MNNPEKELRDYLNELIKRYLFITAYVNQFEILDLWDTPNRIDTLNKGAHFFHLVDRSFLRTIFVESLKLVNKREERSLIKWLSQAKTYAKNLKPSKRNRKTDKHELIKVKDYQDIIIENESKIFNQNEIILKIKGIRDKVIVHTDPLYFLNERAVYKKYPVSLTEVKLLLSTIGDILRQQHDYLMKSAAILELKGLGSVESILKYTRAFMRIRKDKDFIINKGFKPTDYLKEIYP